MGLSWSPLSYWEDVVGVEKRRRWKEEGGVKGDDALVVEHPIAASASAGPD